MVSESVRARWRQLESDLSPIIRKNTGAGALGMDRGEVDDHTAARGLERRVGFLADGPRRIKVEHEALLDAFIGCAKQALKEVGACIVDETIQPTQETK